MRTIWKIAAVFTALAVMATPAVAAKKPSVSPAKACKGKSKKHVKGEKGTPYSRCVAAHKGKKR